MNAPEVGFVMVSQLQPRFTDVLVAGKACKLNEDAVAASKIDGVERILQMHSDRTWRASWFVLH